MEIFHQCFQYSPSNLSDFVEMQFPSTIYVTFLADKCVEMKLLIDIYALYYAESTKKCTGFHILFSRSKHRSLCRVDLSRGQAWWIFCGNGLKI